MTCNVFAAVLAAGRATRFGATKQLADIGGEPMVRRAVLTANEVFGDRTLVVAGHESDAIARACQGTQGFVLVNEAYADGIGSSIARAVSSLAHAASAVVVILADQPLVTAGHLRSLLDAWSGADRQIVATGFANTAGPPVLFPAACFADLMALDGDNGGRRLLRDTRFEVVTIDFEDAAVDVDTARDLKRISRSVRS
jgi:CTP:molybdopterin cytidylyltransferase MocA